MANFNISPNSRKPAQSLGQAAFGRCAFKVKNPFDT